MSDTRSLIIRWRDDAGGTYRSWFLWEERLKNFRAIRSGIREVVAEIAADTFGNVYKGSSLETVVGAIAEQQQIFKGADHAFLWKPKLRIPDIYESRENQVAFGRFLESCCDCDDEATILRQIQALDARKIKGLGPATAIRDCCRMDVHVPASTIKATPRMVQFRRGSLYIERIIVISINPIGAVINRLGPPCRPD